MSAAAAPLAVFEPPSADEAAKIRELCECLGISKRDAKRRLTWCQWDVDFAVNEFFDARAPTKKEMADRERLLREGNNKKRRRCGQPAAFEVHVGRPFTKCTFAFDDRALDDFVRAASAEDAEETCTAAVEAGDSEDVVNLFRAAKLNLEDDDVRFRLSVVMRSAAREAVGVCVFAPVRVEARGVVRVVVDVVAFAVCESKRRAGLGRALFEGVLLCIALNNPELTVLNFPREASRPFWEKMMSHWHEAPSENESRLWLELCRNGGRLGCGQGGSAALRVDMPEPKAGAMQ